MVDNLSCTDELSKYYECLKLNSSRMLDWQCYSDNNPANSFDS